MNDKLREQLLQALQSVPSDQSPAFASEVRKIGLESDPSAIVARLQVLTAIAEDPLVPDDVAFAAFMSALHNYRRRNKKSELRALIARCEPRFAQRRLFQLHRASAGMRANAAELYTAISIARSEIQARPDDVGMLNAYAELIADGFEERSITDERSEMLVDARTASEKALGLAPTYAKYRATFARLLLLQGQYREARSAIDAAIELEDDLKADFHIRLSNYLAIRQRIQQQEQNWQLASELDTARRTIHQDLERTRAELEQSRIKNVEVLAFFSAVIALVLTGAQEAKTLSLAGSQSLLLLLAAVLLIAFAGLGLILYGKIPIERTLSMIAAAAALLFLSTAFRSSEPKGSSAMAASAPAPSASTASQAKETKP